MLTNKLPSPVLLLLFCTYRYQIPIPTDGIIPSIYQYSTLSKVFKWLSRLIKPITLIHVCTLRAGIPVNIEHTEYRFIVMIKSTR
jgi:hypothetical protein